MNLNLAVMLRETASATPGRPVALCAGQRMTYGELDVLSRATRGADGPGVTHVPTRRPVPADESTSGHAIACLPVLS
jgi:hypothetical protein